MTEAVFLGFDAGGSKTVCLVGDRRAVLGRGESGPANPSLVGLDGFRDAVRSAARGALQSVGRRRAAAVWIGIAGSERPSVRESLRRAALDELDADAVSISHDARLLLAAAGVGSGIAVVAGTGSSVYGRAADGREVTVGGWGHLLGDEGSGYDIARRALRVVTQAADGRGPPTALSEAIPAALGVAGVPALRERCYPAISVSEVARLAEVVIEQAAGDEISRSIVADAASDLALAVETCAGRLAVRPGAHLDVVAAGGLLRPGSPLLACLVDRLQRADRRYGVAPLTADPASGALALARDGPDGRAEPAEPHEPPNVHHPDNHVQPPQGGASK